MTRITSIAPNVGTCTRCGARRQARRVIVLDEDGRSEVHVIECSRCSLSEGLHSAHRADRCSEGCRFYRERSRA